MNSMQSKLYVKWFNRILLIENSEKVSNLSTFRFRFVVFVSIHVCTSLSIRNRWKSLCWESRVYSLTEMLHEQRQEINSAHIIFCRPFNKVLQCITNYKGFWQKRMENRFLFEHFPVEFHKYYFSSFFSFCLVLFFDFRFASMHSLAYKWGLRIRFAWKICAAFLSLTAFPLISFFSLHQVSSDEAKTRIKWLYKWTLGTLQNHGCTSNFVCILNVNNKHCIKKIRSEIQRTRLLYELWAMRAINDPNIHMMLQISGTVLTKNNLLTFSHTFSFFNIFEQ